jgi:two-component SAPR family response regulator
MRLDLEHVAVDVEDFRRRAREGLALDRERRTDEAVAALAEAEALYVGDFLEDLYEDWAADLREEARGPLTLRSSKRAPRYWRRA